MDIQRGRLIDHIHLRTQHFKQSKDFYTAVLKVIGVPVVDGVDHFSADELWVDAGVTESRVHLAFQTASRETVDAFYAAALKHHGRDNGAPGEREYHPGYYAAFVLDPDGNNIEAVFHGPHTRSAPSVVFKPA